MYHYVYRISNLHESKHYYGVRSSRISPDCDLGINYFSSSSDKDFILDQKRYPHKFKYKIVRIFSSRKDANEFEHKLHTKFNVGLNENFYNMMISALFGFVKLGIPNTPESNIKRSNALKGRKRLISKQHGESLSKALKGKPKSKEHSNNISKALKGKSKSKEHRLNLTKPKAKKECPHCGVMSTARWHFDNCKKNPNYIHIPRKCSNKPISEETRAKIRKAAAERRSYDGSLNPNARRITVGNICFLSIKDACDFHNLSKYRLLKLAEGLAVI